MGFLGNSIYAFITPRRLQPGLLLHSWNVFAMATSADDSDKLTDKKKAIEKLKNIPNIAAHHNSLLQMLTQDMDDLDIDLISSMAQEDPALTAKILGIANSAYFSNRKTIFTIHDAIINVLGLKLVSSLIIGLLIEGSVKAPDSEYFSMKQFWNDSLTCAFITKKLSQISPNIRINPDDAYLCGLLNNIGLLPLASLFSKELDLVLSNQESVCIKDQLQLEKSIIGVDHAYAGVTLAIKWRLPTQVIESIRHSSDKDYNGDYCAHSVLTRLANVITHKTINTTDTTDNAIIESLHQHADDLDFLGLSAGEFANLYEFAKDISSNINEISEFLANG